MSGLPWFKCYHQDLLDGMAGMPADERGIYISVLCLIYRNGGPVRDEPRELSYLTGCTVARWVKYRAALILHGKLKVVELNGRDHLSNGRCEAEFNAREAQCLEMAERGKKGAEKRRQNSSAKPNKNNGGQLAGAKLEPSASQADREIDIDLEVSDVPPNGETSGGEAPSDDPNKRAWGDAVGLLVGQGAMSADKARAFFGKLLSAHQLEARDLLGSVAEAFNAGTSDPQGYLTKAAAARGKRRQTGPPKRVGWV